MNLLLLHPQDRDGTLYRVADRRARHVLQVLRAVPGSRLKAGLLNGPLGEALLERREDEQLWFRFTPTGPAPTAPDLRLVLALPRPKMLRRILLDATSLGVKTLVLLNSYKVEKSYWQTPELKAGGLHEKLILGLEQSMDTQLPRLILAPRFRPFVEDTLPGLSAGTHGLLAHPGAVRPLPAQQQGAITLAVGPEGGWTPYEVDALTRAGLEPVSMGTRILRVETAVPSLLGRLLPLC